MNNQRDKVVFRRVTSGMCRRGSDMEFHHEYCKLCDDDQWYRPQLAKIEGKEVCLCRPCIIYVADIRDEIAKKAMKNDQKQT